MTRPQPSPYSFLLVWIAVVSGGILFWAFVVLAVKKGLA